MDLTKVLNSNSNPDWKAKQASRKGAPGRTTHTGRNATPLQEAACGEEEQVHSGNKKPCSYSGVESWHLINAPSGTVLDHEALAQEVRRNYDVVLTLLRRLEPEISDRSKATSAISI